MKIITVESLQRELNSFLMPLLAGSWNHTDLTIPCGIDTQLNEDMWNIQQPLCWSVSAKDQSADV